MFSTQEKIFVTLYGTDGSKTYYGDHFAVYTTVKSLYCAPETKLYSNLKFTFLVKDLHPKYITNSENLKIIKPQYNLKNTSVDCALLMGII